MACLPYRARTATGDIFDIEFRLHQETQDAVRVGQLVTALLETIDREFKVAGPMGNGDVLQALAMTLAIRARMIHAPQGATAELSLRLLRDALDAAGSAVRVSPPSGHA